MAKDATHRHKFGSVLFDKRYILSTGRNYPSRSVKHLLPKYKRWEGSLHSEIDCIIKARRSVRGKSLLVIRLSKSGLAMAKPCQHCEKYLRDVGVRSVYYSINKNEFGLMRLN